MDFAHEYHHLSRAFKLWYLNVRAAKSLKQDDNTLYLKELKVVLTNARRKHLKQIVALHRQLYGQNFLKWMYNIYRCKIYELGCVALDEKDNVIGYCLYMFNECELQDKILHEQYVGIVKAYQGLHLSVHLRQFSHSKYKKDAINAISTLAFEGDIKALRSAQKSGFSIVKKSLKPPAFYLIKNL